MLGKNFATQICASACTTRSYILSVYLSSLLQEKFHIWKTSPLAELKVPSFQPFAFSFDYLILLWKGGSKINSREFRMHSK
jgi:hypothetical protein